MRTSFKTVLISISLLIACICQVSAGTELDNYLALRRQHSAGAISLTQLSTNVDQNIGKFFEARGVLTGTAERRGTGIISCIISTDNGTFIAQTDKQPDISSGVRVCILFRVPNDCTSSLNNLQLIAMAYESDVIARENLALKQMADAKAKAAQKEALLKQKELQAKQVTKQTQRQNIQPTQDLVAIYRDAIRSYNNNLSVSEADTIARSILGFSLKYQVDPRLVVAVILAESHFKPYATSPKGAKGLGQLMPGTAAGLGVDNPYDPVANVYGSVRLIRGHLDRISGNADWTELTWKDLTLALASYNAGPGAVKKHGGVPPYKETRNYINKVTTIYKRLCGIK